MSTPSKKLIVVIGATGNQGSSVARTFSSLPNWRVRCLTRNPSSTAAQKLSSLGAEVVQGDLSDPSTLTDVFDSANAIFANTDFWATYLDPETVDVATAVGKTTSEFAFEMEVSHGVNIAKAAAEVSTLERFIYSALGPMKKHSQGKYSHSYHWDSKATIVEYISRELPALAQKMSLIYLGAYVTNPLMQPRWDEKAGKYMLVVPMKKESKMPIVNPQESTGPFVRALVEDEPIGRKLLAYDSFLTMGEVVEIWSKATARKAEFMQVPMETMNKLFGIPLEVLDGPAFIDEFGFMGGVDSFIEREHLKVAPTTTPFEDWLQKQDLNIILESGKAQETSVKGR